MVCLLYPEAKWIDMENFELLQRTVLFKGSKKAELDTVMGLFQERQIKQSTTIFTEKMPAEALYIIKSGTVKITMMVGEGEEMGLLLLGPGDFFGELSLVQEDVRLVNARAETAIDLLLLTRKDFQTLLVLEPRMGVRMRTVITKLLAMRVKVYNERLKELLL
jgi:CRP/FNR family transcriptional regulator, cyclic AMP receptor protein